jgi:ABC-type glycerol-3-phosphate transport system permease component
VRAPSSASTPRASRTLRNDIAISIVLTIMAVVGLFPYLFMLLTSLKSNAQFYENFWLPAWPVHLENYATAWEQIQPYLLISVVVAALSILGTVALGTVAATVIARYRFAGKKVVVGLVALLMLIPSVASIIPLFVLMRDLQLLNTVLGLVIPMTVAGTILAIILVSSYITGIPHEIFEAAVLDGAGGIRAYWSIILPLSRPVVGTVVLVTIINVWNDYFWPALITTENALRTIPVGLQFFRGQNVTEWGPQFAGYFLASLPLLLLFTFLSKQFLAGLSGGLSADR